MKMTRNKKVFLRELKELSKVTVFMAILPFLFFLGMICGVLFDDGKGVMTADMNGIIMAYFFLMFVVMVITAVYRMVKYEKMYRTVNMASFALIGIRLAAVAICMAAATLAFLLGGTILDLLMKHLHPSEYACINRNSFPFSLVGRSPLYITFCLSTAMGAAVVYACFASMIALYRALPSGALRLLALLFDFAVFIIYFLLLALPSGVFGGVFLTSTFFRPVIPYTLGDISNFDGTTIPDGLFGWNIYNPFLFIAGTLLILLPLAISKLAERKCTDPENGIENGGEKAKGDNHV